MKIWLLTNTPSPYQIEFFRELHRSGLFELDVRFMSAAHRGVKTLQEAEASFFHHVLEPIGPRKLAQEYHYHPRAIREVWGGEYDLYILSGHYTSPTFLACAFAAVLRRKPWVMWLERPWPADYRPPWVNRLTPRSPALAATRRGLLRLLIRRTHGLFAIGTVAMEAYRAMGAPPEKLYFLPYYCDVERFAHNDRRDCARILAQIGFLEKTVFLFSGALVLRKGVDLLIKTFKVLAAEMPEVALILMGEGPLRAEYDRKLPLSLADRIRFVGNIPQADLPIWYGAADVFVFPSRHDGWGVVINEACGAGLPIIVTDSVGAARDLVIDGRNGFVIRRDDEAALLSAMKKLARDPALRRQMGSQSRLIAESFTLRAGVAQFWNNVERVLGQRS